jgi:hypothetical protein
MSLFGPLQGSIFLYVVLGTAALAIIAYIIKMRRRRFEVPFSALWKRVLEQKDSNSLWKQLKRLLSLLLILLILGIVLFASLDPTLGTVDREARNVVILIDASASMKAMDGDEDGRISRMEAARRKAAELIDSMGGGDLAMVMKVDGQATPLTRFTSDGPMLKRVIFGQGKGDVDATGSPKPTTTAGADAQTEKNLIAAGIQASDTPADLPRALGAAADALRDRQNPLIVIISDGAYPEQQLGLVSWDPAAPVPPVAVDPKDDKTKKAQWDAKNLATVDLSKIDVRYMPVGKRSDNVGIVAFNVRRYIANKAAYEVYIEVQNFGSEPAHRKLALYNGTTQVDLKTIDLAAGQRIKQIYQKLPASAESQLRAVLRPVEGAGGSDPFPLDDTAYALLPQRKKQKVLMVTTDNLFLEASLLILDDDIVPTKLTPDQYEADPSVAERVDAIIFDEYTPKTLPPPPVNLLFFHPTPEGSPIPIRGKVRSPRITEVDEGHPIMRWVTLSDVYTDESNVFAPDGKKGESGIAYFVRDPIVATKRDGKRKIAAFGFSLPAEGRESATDLPMRVAFPMMLINTLDWFAGDTTDLLTTYPTGKRERIPLDGVVGATEAEVKGPDGLLAHTPIIDGLATFYGQRVGYYDVAAKGPKGNTLAQIQLAANLASPSESDIAPSAELSLGGKKLEAPEKFAISHSRKIWIYLLFIAMALIVMEWITYHRRITV